MRLVIERKGVNGGAGLNRYNGRGIYQNIGRKVLLSGLRKVKKDEAEIADLDEKIEGKGIDVVDSSNSDESTKVDSDEKSSMKSVHNDEESIQNDEESNEKSDEETEASGVKRKYSPSVIDFLINNNTKDSSTPPKLQCLDSSMSYCHDENDTHLNTLLNEKKNHSLIKIPPTKKKRYPQKICVHCRRNLGVRNDTRYICTLCEVALCKQPCFAEYHCNK